MWGKAVADEGNSGKAVEGEGAGVEKKSQTESVLEKGIEKQLKWNLEVVRQMGKTGEARGRSKDLQEGFQVRVG